jgi:hypothetical protein
MPSERLHGPPGFARDALVARMAHDLGRDGAPRLQLLTIMLLAGGVAFLASVLLLWPPDARSIGGVIRSVSGSTAR